MGALMKAMGIATGKQNLTFNIYFYDSGNVELNRAIASFAALAQETRLGIFRLLVRQGSVGMAAGKIAERLKIPANTLSFHLSQLAHAGLIESRRAGRVIHYSIRVDGIRGLIAYLIEDCCMDRPEFCDLDPAAGPCCQPTGNVHSPASKPTKRRGNARAKRKP